MNAVSAVLIAANEAGNLPECIAGLGFCQEVVVVVDPANDGGSAEAARKAGARVYEHAFTDFASQKNFAIEKAQGPWLYLVDADERTTPELAKEILAAVAKERLSAYWLRRKNRLFGRWMRHGASSGDWQLRLVKKPARFEGLIHERIATPAGAGRLRRPLLHYSTPDVRSYMRKLNVYTGLEARQSESRGLAVGVSLRRPLARLLRDVFWKRGMADGREGILFAVLSAYYDFVRRCKHWEVAKGKK